MHCYNAFMSWGIWWLFFFVLLLKMLWTWDVFSFNIVNYRLLPLYFPRDKHEEEVAISKLPADVGDENGETIIDERKIRIKPLPKKTIPKPPQAPVELPVSDVGLVRRSVNSFMIKSLIFPYFLNILFLVLDWSNISMCRYCNVGVSMSQPCVFVGLICSFSKYFIG